MLFNAATIEFRFGWLVVPLIEAMAPSATSTPASEAFRIELALMPLVSCVWKWIGNPISFAQRAHQFLGGIRFAKLRPCP